MNLIQTEKAMMTSRDIADLVGSRHDKVKQSIVRLYTPVVDDDGTVRRFAVISQPPVGDGQKSGNGVVEKVFIFEGEQGKRDSFVVVAQLSPEFTARLVDRWQELESKQAPTVPQTYAAALLEAGRLAQLAEEQAEKLAIAAPKVQFVDTLVERGTLMTATQVGQKHKISAVKLNRILDEVGGIYSKGVKRSRVFTQQWIDKGYGEMKQTELGHSQALFTPSGEYRISEILTSEGLI